MICLYFILMVNIMFMKMLYQQYEHINKYFYAYVYSFLTIVSLCRNKKKLDGKIKVSSMHNVEKF